MSTPLVPEVMVVMKPLEWFVHYVRNPRKNDDVIDQSRMRAPSSIWRLRNIDSKTIEERLKRTKTPFA